MSKLVQFHELAVGTEFNYEGVRYKKIDTIKVSCCTAINAARVDNPESKKFIVPINQVEVDD
jgi:hypothetical protein